MEEKMDRIQQMIRKTTEEFIDISGKGKAVPTHYEIKMLDAGDGVHLKTHITRPVQEGAFPVIVQRGPYGDYTAKAAGEGWAKLGFAYVFQCCRGTFGSEGEWVPNENERSDGLSLLNWLQEAPWVESIGYYGASYLALTGYAMVDCLPPKVRSMHLSVYGTDRHASAYCDGLFRQDILTGWTIGSCGRGLPEARKDSDFYLRSYAYRPQLEVDKAMWGGELTWYRDWISHPDRDDPYWQSGFWALLREMPGKLPDIPILICEGWYDHHLGSALRGCEQINPEQNSSVVIRIGPWNHSGESALSCHPGTRNEGKNDLAHAASWFADTLQKGLRPKGEVQYYNIGLDRWETAPAYPFAESREKRFYLSMDGLENAPGAPGCRSYDYDPETPVMTWGAESLLTNVQWTGSRPQPEPNYREDVISFVSQPFTEPVDVLGKIKVHLYAESSAADTCFAVKLIEIRSDGTACNIRNGITTLAYRNNADHRGTYAGGLVAFTIDTWDIAWHFRIGSRLRLDITSSNFPEYAVHSNFPGLWSTQRETQIAHQTIHFGPSTPSCVILPIKST